MGAVKWTWPELADMHLCLGAARLTGGDAAEAKQLYLKSYPNRDAPTQGMFIAIDLSLRTSGNLLSTSPSAHPKVFFQRSPKTFVHCNTKPAVNLKQTQESSTLPVPAFVIVKPPASGSTPGSPPVPLGPPGAPATPGPSEHSAGLAMRSIPRSLSAPPAGFLIVRSTGSNPALLPGKRVKPIAPKAFSKNPSCSKPSDSHNEADSHNEGQSKKTSGNPCSLFCFEEMPSNTAGDNQTTRRAADVLKKYRIQRKNRGTLKPIVPKTSNEVLSAKSGRGSCLRTIKPKTRDQSTAPRLEAEPFPRKSPMKIHPAHTKENESQNQKPEKPVHCRQCSRLFPTKQNFERHICMKHVCQKCGAKFKWKCILERHMTTHSEERPYVCEDCGKSFKGAGAFAYHRRTHTGERPFECEDCGNVFNANSHLQRHRKKRACNSAMSLLKKKIDSEGGRFQAGKYSSNRKECVCETCGKVEWTESRLKAHMMIHTGERPFECRICGSNFRNRGRLDLHLRKKHQEPYKCSECGEAFPEKGALDGHMPVHAVEASYHCSECGKNFNNKVTLEAHMRVHSGDKAFECSVCQSTFLEKIRLDAHMFLHTKTKPFVCTECGKGFTAKASLESHTRNKHRGEKFMCDHCGKPFASSATLSGHKMLHTGEKPFVCSECGKAFIRKVTLDAHIRSHTGEKPFVCNECGKAFNRTSTLQTHRKLLHKRINAVQAVPESALPASNTASQREGEGDFTLTSL